MSFTRRSILASLIAGTISAGQIGLASAADVTVCPSGCDYSSVQAGIDVAGVGDIVLVGTPGRTTPETYVENIQMKEGVDVVSEGGDVTIPYVDPFNVLRTWETARPVMERTTLTILRGAGNTPVVSYMGGVNDSVLDGFIIENIDDTADDYTSLVFVGGSSPTIQNNVIRDNLGPAHNGGIQVGSATIIGDAEPLIQNNIIHYVNGHGVGITDDGNPTIQNNVIFTRATVTDYAPGIGFRGAGAATILNNEIFRSGRAGIGAAVPPILNAEGGGLAGGNGNPIIIRGNYIHSNSYAAIRLDSVSGADVSDVHIIIGGPNAEDGNTFNLNFAGLRIYVSGSSKFGSVTVQNNIHDRSGVGAYINDVEDLTITQNTFKGLVFAGSATSDPLKTAACGIRMADITNAEISRNNITNFGYCGIRMFYKWNYTMDSLVIDRNTINGSGYAGIIIDEIVTSGSITNNTINNSGLGGLVFPAAGTYDVLNNDISFSQRGGIHTGPGFGTPGQDGVGVWMPAVFRGNPGELNLTIRGNAVHHNGSGDFGGGIDVRHASGVIENNLVYDNHFGGIRFGDWITAINNNTVVGNGQTGLRGAGIVFDDLAGDVNADPEGSPSNPFPMRNNILVNNYNAGVNAGTLFTSGASCGDWVGLREYNLYSQNNGASTGCHGNAFPFCYFTQTALCSFNDGESNSAPEFVDAANGDYRLMASSVAVDGAAPGTADDLALPPGEGSLAADMGAYGGEHGITTFGNQ